MAHYSSNRRGRALPPGKAYGLKIQIVGSRLPHHRINIDFSRREAARPERPPREKKEPFPLPGPPERVSPKSRPVGHRRIEERNQRKPSQEIPLAAFPLAGDRNPPPQAPPVHAPPSKSPVEDRAIRAAEKMGGLALNGPLTFIAWRRERGFALVEALFILEPEFRPHFVECMAALNLTCSGRTPNSHAVL